MIDRTALPTISETLRLLGVEPRGRRSKCPVHGGDNAQALAFDDDKGVWNCFRCGKGGDVIRLVELAQQTDFAGALRFFGLEPGRPPAPDPAVERRERIRRRLAAWVRSEARALRDDFYLRQRLEVIAMRILDADHDSEGGWLLLRDAVVGIDNLEDRLDAIDHKLADDELLAAYRETRRAA